MILLFTQRGTFVHLRFRKQKRRQFTEKGSYTVEAAVVLPVFLCLMVCILMLFVLLTTQWKIQKSMQSAAQTMALQKNGGFIKGKPGGKQEILIATILLTQKKIKKAQVSGKIISGGTAGILFYHSRVTDKKIVLVADYSMTVPFRMLGSPVWHLRQQVNAKRWVGRDPSENQKGAYVYVTKYGKDWHSRPDCPYLKLSIQAVSKEAVAQKRNRSGGRYKPCPLCKRHKGQSYFITDYGEEYHTTLECSALKRQIQKIPKEKAAGYAPCPKCTEK